MNNQVIAIVDQNLVVRRTGKIIEETEPIFILRASDRKALSTIRVYQSIFAPTSEHWKVIQDVIDDFTKFREKNLDTKMKEPSECY